MKISDAHKKADPKAFYYAKDQKQLVNRYDEAAGVYDEAMSTDVGWTGHLAQKSHRADPSFGERL